jgi:hypothetical protein
MTNPTNTQPETQPTYSAFAGHRRIASGPLDEMLRVVKRHLDQGGEPVLIFEDETGRQVDFDFSGTADDVVARATARTARSGPGRPKLGVVSREVSLLPRHWEWLEEQPNGISAALRRVIDEARKREPGAQRARRVRDAAAKFMWSAGGDLPGFEDAARALYARDYARLATLIHGWPTDVRDHVEQLAGRARALDEMPQAS